MDERFCKNFLISARRHRSVQRYAKVISLQYSITFISQENWNSKASISSSDWINSHQNTIERVIVQLISEENCFHFCHFEVISELILNRLNGDYSCTHIPRSVRVVYFIHGLTFDQITATGMADSFAVATKPI